MKDEKEQKALLVDMQYALARFLQSYYRRGLRSDLLFVGAVSCVACNATRFVQPGAYDALAEQLEQAVDMGINEYIEQENAKKGKK